MRKMVAAAAGLAAMAIAGCSGQVSNVGANTPPAARVVYPITAEQADQALSKAMVAAFPETPISSVSLPHKGYTATIRFALDSHRITAMTMPGIGVTPSGDRVNGYSFQVSNAGTMPATGTNRSNALFERINREASALAAPLPAATQ